MTTIVNPLKRAIQINLADIQRNEEGTDLEVGSDKVICKVWEAARAILKRHRSDLKSCLTICNQFVFLTAPETEERAGFEGSGFSDKNCELWARRFRKDVEGIRDVLLRVVRKNEARKLNKSEKEILKFFEAIWALQLRGGSAVIAPHSDSPWFVEPIDPALLRAAEPEALEKASISAAPVIGIVIVGDLPQPDAPSFHNARVNCIVHFKHEIGAVSIDLSPREIDAIKLCRTNASGEVQTTNFKTFEAVGEFQFFIPKVDLFT